MRRIFRLLSLVRRRVDLLHVLPVDEVGRHFRVRCKAENPLHFESLVEFNRPMLIVRALDLVNPTTMQRFQPFTRSN